MCAFVCRECVVATYNRRRWLKLFKCRNFLRFFKFFLPYQRRAPRKKNTKNYQEIFTFFCFVEVRELGSAGRVEVEWDICTSNSKFSINLPYPKFGTKYIFFVFCYKKLLVFWFGWNIYISIAVARAEREVASGGVGGVLPWHLRLYYTVDVIGWMNTQDSCMKSPTAAGNDTTFPPSAPLSRQPTNLANSSNGTTELRVEFEFATEDSSAKIY